MRKRTEDERVRVAHGIHSARATLDSLERALKLPGPIGSEAATALTLATLEIVRSISRHDALDLAGIE